MSRRRAASRLGALALGLAFAQSLTVSSVAVAAPVDLAAIGGVYKDRFPNGDVGGATWTSENVLEIVPLTPKTAYVKTHLEFYNGHQCALAGVADVVGDALVYVDRSDDATIAGGKRCTLSLHVSGTTITFDDPDLACKATYCGARGGFAVEFARTARRPIRYMRLLRNSDDFHRAVAEHARPERAAP